MRSVRIKALFPVPLEADHVAAEKIWAKVVCDGESVNTPHG